MPLTDLSLCRNHPKSKESFEGYLTRWRRPSSPYSLSSAWTNKSLQPSHPPLVWLLNWQMRWREPKTRILRKNYFKTFLSLRLCWVCLMPLGRSIGKYSFLKWWMLAIIPISCSLVSPELVETGGPIPFWRLGRSWESELLGFKKADGPSENLLIWLLALILKLLKESLPHTLFVYQTMLQLMMLQLVK